MRQFFILIAPLILAGCETNGEPEGGPQFALVGASGQVLGQVRMWESPGRVTFRIGAAGLPHGIHGVHVHGVGRCEGPGFASAGPHWNPAARKHGLNNPAGHHAGDLPNVDVAANGVLGATVVLPGTDMRTLLDADGASIVIHAAADDYATDPSGNSGARIACAVITPTPELR